MKISYLPWSSGFAHGRSKMVNDPQQWLAERLAELDAGNIEAIIDAANEYPLYGVKATDRDKALTCFQTNTVRMRYAHYRKLGMFIGSGNVEAGCKAVIEQRLKLSGMKLSGMRLTRPGATGILTLRCRQASGQWDQIWTRSGPHPTTRPTGSTSPLRDLILITYKSAPHPPAEGHGRDCQTRQA
jgi:hypothetical protein